MIQIATTFDRLNEVDWSSKKVLITGGTGSFGQAFVRYALENLHPEVIRVFSRDELKQHEMKQKLNAPNLRFFIGDIRDRERVERALRGVDIVIHAAAMKRIEVCEYNPFEAIKTNIIGTQNLIDFAIDCGVERVMALSTDKAANPINLYGATKLCQEKIVVQSNSYVGPKKTKLACVRYGNVVGSRGSVVPLFRQQRENGKVSITDERMTRFWISLPQAVRFVHHCIEQMQGGEVFVPKLPSVRITDLAKALCPEAEKEIIGIRGGEKLHEVLISSEEAPNTLEYEDHFLIQPSFGWWHKPNGAKGKPMPDETAYTSQNNKEFLSVEALRKIDYEQTI